MVHPSLGRWHRASELCLFSWCHLRGRKELWASHPCPTWWPQFSRLFTVWLLHDQCLLTQHWLSLAWFHHASNDHRLSLGLLYCRSLSSGVRRRWNTVTQEQGNCIRDDLLLKVYFVWLHVCECPCVCTHIRVLLQEPSSFAFEAGTLAALNSLVELASLVSKFLGASYFSFSSCLDYTFRLPHTGAVVVWLV